MKPVNLRSFAQKVKINKLAFKRFLGKVEKKAPSNLYKTMLSIDEQVWNEVDCLTCANCCKKMTPTFTSKDISRISTYLNMNADEFKEKWLYEEKKGGDWMNKKQPCQFLNKQNNMCSIYEVRPADCAGFPHFKKKNPLLYIHVHQQNVEYCPATYNMVEKLKEQLDLK